VKAKLASGGIPAFDKGVQSRAGIPERLLDPFTSLDASRQVVEERDGLSALPYRSVVRSLKVVRRLQPLEPGLELSGLVDQPLERAAQLVAATRLWLSRDLRRGVPAQAIPSLAVLLRRQPIIPGIGSTTWQAQRKRSADSDPATVEVG
jgi:hypothetical protein